MNKTIILIIITVLFFSCKQKEKNDNEFLSNFKETSLPYTFDVSEEYNNVEQLQQIQTKFLYLFDIDTTGKIIKVDSVSHYSEDFFYKNIIKTNKKFDMIIVGKRPYPQDELPFYNLLLCTISPKTGKVIDKIVFSTKMIDFFEKITSISTINKDLSIKVEIIDSLTDEPDDNMIYHFDIYTTKLKYSITDNGIFELKDSVRTHQTALIKEKSEETAIDSSAIDFLKHKLSEEEFDFINKVASEYKNCNSPSQIEYIVNQEAHFLDILNNKIFNNYDAVDKDIDMFQKMFSNYIPFIYIDYGAEGCCIDASYNYYSIYKKALETPEKDDDIFFDAYESMNKKVSDEYGTYFSSWDMFFYEEDFETSYSRLGNGNFIKAFRTIEDSRIKTTLFSEQFSNFKLGLTHDFIGYEQFYYSKEKVLNELNSILSEIEFNEPVKQDEINYNKQDIIDYIKKIKNLPNTDFNMGDEN